MKFMFTDKYRDTGL